MKTLLTDLTVSYPIDSGEPTAQVARDLGMSRATLYRRLRTLE